LKGISFIAHPTAVLKGMDCLLSALPWQKNILMAGGRGLTMPECSTILWHIAKAESVTTGPKLALSAAD